MNQISSYLLLGFEGTAKDLLITFGLDAGAAPPVIVAPQGGGTSHKLRKRGKSTVIRFSDFEARDDYEKKLRDAVVKSGLVIASPEALLEAQEQSDNVQFSASDAMRAADTEIKISADLRARLDAVRNDEAAMMMILLTML